MNQFKIKVYLPETRASEVIKEVPYQFDFTSWTFGVANSRYQVGFEQDSGITFYRYSDVEYVDGSKWDLMDIDACLPLKSVFFSNNYHIFKRAIRQLPIYNLPEDYDHLPNGFNLSNVQKWFPLAQDFDGAVIGGSEYRLKEKGLFRAARQRTEPAGGSDSMLLHFKTAEIVGKQKRSVAWTTHRINPASQAMAAYAP